MKYIHIIVPAVLAIILSLSSKRVAAQPICASPFLDNPQNRKLCATLANIFGFPNTVETFSEEIRPNYGLLTLAEPKEHPNDSIVFADLLKQGPAQQNQLRG